MLKTILHHYCLDTKNPNDKQAWEDLKAKLNPTHLDGQMNSHSFGNQPITLRNDSEEVELDPSCLFSNQWNEAADPGRRLFDWYLQYRLSGKNFKQGHWLEITPEMEAIRNNTKKCGYCGKMTTDPDQKFCDNCLGSEYLKESEIFLLRMLPISYTGNRPALLPYELSTLLPLYNAAQGLGKLSREEAAKSRNRKKVAGLISEAESASAKLMLAAKKKTEAFTWLLDQNLNILDNVIYYDHTDTFCFGWRDGIRDQEDLKTKLKDFPFTWEVK